MAPKKVVYPKKSVYPDTNSLRQLIWYAKSWGKKGK